jgi:CheY-like chemotaxis protein
VSAQARILVVDDEDDVRDMIAYALSSEGYAVSTTASGDDAVAAARSGAVELVICDIKMPGMDGVEITRRMKQVAPNLPIVIVTGFLSEDTLAACNAGGASAYLRKPFELAELICVVKDLVRG